MSDHDDHPPDGGFALDMTATFNRRRALQMMLGAGAVLVGIGCGDGGGSPSASSTTGATGTTGSAAVADTALCDPVIPQETAGPFPGDGSNGPNVLSQSGVVRSDIRSSFAGMGGTAAGVPLTIEFEVLDADDGCSPMTGAAIYVWHCDRDGGYSLYSSGLENVNYLRGLQVADSAGTVAFTSVFPACYPGRWPHVHFEVYASQSDATSGGQPVATSQMALPRAICDAVYATDWYEASVGTLAQLTLQTDNVFGDDGAVHQLARIAGDVSGVTARLVVPV